VIDDFVGKVVVEVNIDLVNVMIEFSMVLFEGIVGYDGILVDELVLCMWIEFVV